MPKFSIIIPTYNSSATLEACLNSVLTQSFTNFEVLIMDGCSKDNTFDIARSFSDERIRVYSEPDTGVYDAMNKGIDKVQGEWLYFLGSDDTFYSNDVLKNVSLYLNEGKADVIYGDVKITGTNNWFKDKSGIYGGEFDLKRILNSNMSHQAIFYKVQLFGLWGKYDQRYTALADYDLNLRLFSKVDFRHVPLLIANYSPNGLSNNVTDHLFWEDKGYNLVEYYKKILHRKEFDLFAGYIGRYGISEIRKMHPKGFYYIAVALIKYFKIKIIKC